MPVTEWPWADFSAQDFEDNFGLFTETRFFDKATGAYMCATAVLPNTPAGDQLRVQLI